MGARRERSARAGARAGALHVATPVTIVAVEGDDRVTVRIPNADAVSTTPTTRPTAARVAAIAGYVPSVGDRVLCAGDGGDLYVIAVLRAATPPALQGPMTLPDGAVVDLNAGALELRDPAGRLLVRYAAGAAEIAAPAGDLILSSPSGRVVLRSGLDVAIEAARDVVHHAGRAVELSARPAAGGSAPAQMRLDARRVTVTADEVVTEARETRVVADAVSTTAGAVTTRSDSYALTTARYELSASRLVEKARDAFRDVTDLAQSRIGRVRTIVAGAYTQRARRTVITSSDDTSIDGRKIHLG